MELYEKKGYLNSQFRIFHLTDNLRQDFNYHFHEFDKIILFLQGQVTYHIEGHSYLLKPYDFVFVHHHEIHKPSIDASLPYERIILYLAPDFLGSYQTPDYDLNSCFITAKQEDSHVMRGLVSENNNLYQALKRLKYAYEDNGYANDLYCQVLFLDFMIQLNRAVNGEQPKYLPSSSPPSKVLQIISYINEHLTEDLSIETISANFYLSKYHMMRLFKEETGFTIGQYITQKRLLLAKELIKQQHPVTSICFSCGFHNYSTFFRAYKSFFGKSPRNSASPKEAT